MNSPVPVILFTLYAGGFACLVWVVFFSPTDDVGPENAALAERIRGDPVWATVTLALLVLWPLALLTAATLKNRLPPPEP